MLSGKEKQLLSAAEIETYVNSPVRIMGNPASPLVVAKDICILIQIGKGNVSKTIGQFGEHEKAKMDVNCPRTPTSSSTHLLSVLTMKGVEKLLTYSRSPDAPGIFNWLISILDPIILVARARNSYCQPNPFVNSNQDNVAGLLTAIPATMLTSVATPMTTPSVVTPIQVHPGNVTINIPHPLHSLYY